MKYLTVLCQVLLVLSLGLSTSLMSKEVENKRSGVVAIDIGHTEKKAGATSARGESEFSFNKRIALKLHAVLVERGLTGSFVINADGGAIKLRERTAQAHKKKADLFVSIHHDSAQVRFLKKWTYKGKRYWHGEKFKGFSLFISDKTAQKKENLKLAESIGRKLLARKLVPTLHHAMPIKGENRALLNKSLGIYAYPTLAVLRTAKIPAVLVECGIIVNKDEELLLKSDVYQNTIARSLADGIIAYLDARL